MICYILCKHPPYPYSHLMGRAHIEAFFHAAQKLERERIADDLEHGFVDDEGHHIQYAEAIRNRSAS